MAIFLPPTMLADAAYVPPSTSYANSGGTGNRTATITITLSGGLSGSGTGDKLVDGSFGTTSATAVFFNAVSNGVITADFGVGAQKYINEFKWYQNGTAPHGTWVFEGSNDNSSYTTLGSSFTLDGISIGTAFTITHASPAPYRYYRLRQTAGTTSTAPWNQEWEFKIG